MYRILIFLLIMPIGVFSQVSASFEITPESASYCVGDTLVFINNSSGNASSHWFFGDGTDTWIENPQHIYLESGEFIVKLIAYDNSGEKDSTQMQIIVNAAPSVELETNSQDYSIIAHTTGADSLFWYFNGNLTGETDSVVYYLDYGIYTVVAKNTYGCSDSASIKIGVDTNASTSTNQQDIVVKNNILTPDINDGINDVLYIQGLSQYEYPCSVTIFNKNGNLVYFNDNYSNLGGFDGTDNKGRRLPAGTYFYVIKSQNKKTATGYIDLIR